ncbi:MAG: hypothetical protein EP344_17235 [Bacteroidetes bacterium]|nr:MAG: hypothetical protein EP344_17235 [Bacteroidota bacterium]
MSNYLNRFIFMKAYCVLLLLLAASVLPAQTPRLVVPVGNTQDVNAAVFSPDGKYILTGSGGTLIGVRGEAKLWDLKGHELLTFAGHDSDVSAVAFSPDGKQILTGSPDQTAMLWDLQGRKVQTFKGHNFGVYSVAFSPDGKQILTGSGDNTAKLWDLQGRVVRTFKGHTSSVTSVAFSPDGSQVLTGSDDNTAKLWDLQGRVVRTFQGHTLGITTVAFSPDGQQVLTGSEDGLTKLWDVSGRELQNFTIQPFGVQSVAFSPDGRQVLTGAKDGAVKLWDLEGREIRVIKQTAWVTSAVFSPDGQRILTGTKDYTARLWDLEGREVQIFRGYASKITAVAIAPDGRRLVTGSEDKNARLWDVERREVRSLTGHTEQVKSVAFTSDGDRILTGGGDDMAKLWDLQGREVKTFQHNRLFYATLTKVGDGDGVLTTGGNSAGYLTQWWNLQGGKAASFTGPSSSYAVSPDGQSVLCRGNGYDMELRDRTGKVLQTFSGGHNDNVMVAAFSPDGQQVLTGSVDKTAVLWDLQGRMVQTFKGHTASLFSVGFSPDGRSVLTTSMDNTARLWDLQGKNIKTFKHPHWVTSAAFSSDGRHVMTGSWDNTAKLWDVATGVELAMLLSVGTSDWVVASPSGLFDASPGAMHLLYFVAGLEVIELDQLKERYFEPGLLSRLLGITAGETRQVTALNTVDLYPEITASVREDQLDITLTPRSGGMGKLSFFINGKEVSENLNPGGQTAWTVDLKTFEKYYLPGENTLALRAYSSDNWLKSPAYALAYTPPAKSKGTGDNKPAPTLGRAKPHLFAIVIGTSDYSGDQLDLRFPDHDASSIAQALSNAGKALFEDRVHVHLLTTDGKTAGDISSKTNIAAAFADVAGKAQPTDILVVYFSGHGISYGNAEKSQFYYLTKDIANDDLSDPKVRENATVSSEDLTKWLTAITALKQVMVLDACNSGKVVEALSAIGARSLNSSQIRALDRMKDRTGMFVLTGAAADKVSFEASQYGQGLLTYSLLQGMSGLALTSDKRVDVMTLFQYARDQVPELARGIRQVQIPVVSFPAGGGSFDIGIVGPGVKIPLAQVKPVFIRNVFQDEDSFDDVLGLTPALADYFQQITARGAQANLIYVDVNEYEDAYSIKGRYQISGNTVTVRGRLFKGKESKGEFELEGKKADVPGLAQAIISKVSGML